MDETKIFGGIEISDVQVENVLKDVIETLKERGYDPINQIVGYLMSGDPGYISSYKDARKKIIGIERTRIIEILVKNYIK